MFHALEKKSDKNTGFSSSWTLQNSSHPKGPQPSPAIKQWLDTRCEGKGPEETQVNPQNTDGSTEKECSSPSQNELSPPKKVKLIPMPFATLEEPQAQPVPHRPHSLASHRPAGAHPAQPGSSNSAQPTVVCSSWPSPTSLTGPARTSEPIITKPTQPDSTNQTQPSIPQSAASGPVPYKTSSCNSFQW